jgi:hypothetical protein
MSEQASGPRRHERFDEFCDVIAAVCRDAKGWYCRLVVDQNAFLCVLGEPHGVRLETSLSFSNNLRIVTRTPSALVFRLFSLSSSAVQKRLKQLFFLNRNPAVGKRTSNSSAILNSILQHLQAQELQTVEKPKVSYTSLHWARHPSGSKLTPVSIFFLFFFSQTNKRPPWTARAWDLV